MYINIYIYMVVYSSIADSLVPQVQKMPSFLLQYKFKHNCTNIWKSNILINILYSRIILPLWETHTNLEEVKAEQCFTG